MNNIFKIFKELGIEYVHHTHPPVFTCEEADKHCKNVNGAKSKNLFLRNRNGDRHYLFVVSSNKRIDLKTLAKQLNEKALSFASEERLQKYLGCSQGSVSLLGVMNDTKHEVTILVDRDLWQSERLHYHPPGDNTATLELSREDLEKFLKWSGHEVQII